MDSEYTIHLEPNVYERLEEESREVHRDKDAIVNDLIRRHQLQRTMERLQREAEPRARAAGWNSEEDVFRDIS